MLAGDDLYPPGPLARPAGGLDFPRQLPSAPRARRPGLAGQSNRITTTCARACWDIRSFYRRRPRLHEPCPILYRQLTDRIGQGLMNIGPRVHARPPATARPRAVQDHARPRPSTLYTAAGHRPGQASRPQPHRCDVPARGRSARALACSTRHLPCTANWAIRGRSRDALDTLGCASQHLGRHAEAIAYYQQAISLFVKTGNQYNQAEALTHLADAHQTLGDTGEHPGPPGCERWPSGRPGTRSDADPSAPNSASKSNPAPTPPVW